MFHLRYLLLPVIFLLTVGSVSAQNNPQRVTNQVSDQFYIKIGTGASFAEKARVNAPATIWDPANQGYTSRLGTRPIFAFGIGVQSICSSFSTDLVYSFRPQYKYRKFQTTVASSTTPGNLGAKTREMDLDVSSLMLSGYWSGFGCEALTWRPGCSGSITPFLGAGVGLSRLTIYNFRSTGLPSVDPTVNPAPGFGSDNAYTVRTNFTYQLMAGLEYHFCDLWTLSLGYRWLDAGRYKGPSFIRRPPGTALDIRGSEWRARFEAQEILLELKFAI